MSIEYTYPKPMSNFSLPHLKDIPAANRKAVMSEEWDRIATKEMMEAVKNSIKRWNKCMLLILGKIQNTSEMRNQAREWSQCVSTIILSLHNDIIAISESRKENSQPLKEAAWHCASALRNWSEAIAHETDPEAIRELAHLGIDFLKKHDMTQKDALYELQLVAAREVKERTGI